MTPAITLPLFVVVGKTGARGFFRNNSSKIVVSRNTAKIYLAEISMPTTLTEYYKQIKDIDFSPKDLLAYIQKYKSLYTKKVKDATKSITDFILNQKNKIQHSLSYMNKKRQDKFLSLNISAKLPAILVLNKKNKARWVFKKTCIKVQVGAVMTRTHWELNTK